MKPQYGLPSNPKAFLFDNAIPDPRGFRRSLIRPQGIEEVELQEQEAVAQNSRHRLRVVFWPTLALCLPITLLSAALLLLVFYNRITPETSLFEENRKQHSYSQYILVDFSASTYS